MASSTDLELKEVEETTAAGADDEDTGAAVAPIVKLEEVAVSTGEEDEDAILDLKSKHYWFDKEGNQWKDGTVKFLKMLGNLEVNPLPSKAIIVGLLVGYSDLVALKISGFKRIQFR